MNITWKQFKDLVDEKAKEQGLTDEEVKIEYIDTYSCPTVEEIENMILIKNRMLTIW